MQRFARQIECYLEMFRRGECDNAFHGLNEADREILPELIAVFRRERDIELRDFLVEVIWQYREPSVIPFLGEALSDMEPRIWKQALDGLVAFASPDALDELRRARMRRFSSQSESNEFNRWLDEAIKQAETKNEYE